MRVQHNYLILCVALVLQTACSSEQFKRTTYDALHERQLQQCREEGRQDCQRSESYDEYERKRNEAQQDTN